MKTNIEKINGTYAVNIGAALYFEGFDEDGDPIIGDCEIYRAINGDTFAYSFDTKSVVENFGDETYYNSKYFHHSTNKRGRHANSNNKKTLRLPAPITDKTLKCLPF